MNICENEQLGPFWVTISDWDGERIELKMMRGDWEAVPVEYFPLETPVADIWRRAVELTQAKLAQWQKELDEFTPPGEPA